jgi:hypothetical protein
MARIGGAEGSGSGVDVLATTDATSSFEESSVTSGVATATFGVVEAEGSFAASPLGHIKKAPAPIRVPSNTTAEAMIATKGIEDRVLAAGFAACVIEATLFVLGAIGAVAGTSAEGAFFGEAWAGGAGCGARFG